MSETTITVIVIASIFIALVNSIRAAHWKARCNVVEQENNQDGWRNEAMFWRAHFNRDAAEAADELS